MKLNDSSFEFQENAVVAFPDTTRLAGYRAALGLWSYLDASSNNSISHKISIATFECKPEEVIESQQQFAEDSAQGISTSGQDQPTGISVVFASAQAAEPRITFCFVNGLPEQKRVPEFVDSLIGLLERNGVKRVVTAAAANVAGVKDSDDQLWAHLPQRSVGGQLAQSLSDVQRLPAGGVDTNDVFLSAFSNLVEVSSIAEVGVLLHGDKRPSGSTNRQRSTFGGGNCADDSDGRVVGALSEALAAAFGCAPGDAVSAGALDTEVSRIRLDIESAAKGLSAFS
ncbi:hypothetical protein J3B02_001129 [Coemansia erecta]|nr:hypothetical protein J3B02_001129 [Coemansia erecta]